MRALGGGVGRRAALAAAALLLAGCTAEGATVQGKEINRLYTIVLAVAAVVFLAVEGAIVYAAVRFRRRDNELPSQFHGNLAVEVVWTAIPTVIVLALFFLSIQTLDRVEARAANPAVTIEVEGFQWQWNFSYPGDADDTADDFTVRGTISAPPIIMIPVNETVRLNLHSDDVIHAWYVPEFLFKQDVVPGRTNSFDINSDELGSYTGQCAELCGVLHARMTFTIETVTRPAYDAWVAGQQALEQARRDRLQACAENPVSSGEYTIVAQGVTFVQVDPETGDPLLDEATALPAVLECFAVPAGGEFTVHFDNRDQATPHNVSIYRGKETILTGDPVTGPDETVDYPIPALEAGEYTYICIYHPVADMTGTLTAE